MKACCNYNLPMQVLEDNQTVAGSSHMCGSQQAG